MVDFVWNEHLLRICEVDKVPSKVDLHLRSEPSDYSAERWLLVETCPHHEECQCRVLVPCSENAPMPQIGGWNDFVVVGFDDRIAFIDWRSNRIGLELQSAPCFHTMILKPALCALCLFESEAFVVDASLTVVGRVVLAEVIEGIDTDGPNRVELALRGGDRVVIDLPDAVSSDSV